MPTPLELASPLGSTSLPGGVGSTPWEVEHRDSTQGQRMSLTQKPRNQRGIVQSTQVEKKVALSGWRGRFAEGSRDARVDALQCMRWCDEAPNAIRSWVFTYHYFKTTNTTKFGCINTNFRFRTPMGVSMNSKG
jgi:hypothetical protein